MAVDTSTMAGAALQSGGASSFGWSGIIAHAVAERRQIAFVDLKETLTHGSLYRTFMALGHAERDK